jgi:hypothetical protein
MSSCGAGKSSPERWRRRLDEGPLAGDDADLYVLKRRSYLMSRTSGEERRAIAERQQKCWHLRVVRKLHLPEIAAAMHISERQVERDLTAVRKRSRDLLQRAHRAEEAILDAGVEAVEETEAVSRQAWTHFQAAPKGTAVCARFLHVVLKAQEQRVRILQSLGLMERAPEKVAVDSSNFFDRLGPEAQRATDEEKLALARKMLDLARQELHGDVGPTAGTTSEVPETQPKT